MATNATTMAQDGHGDGHHDDHHGPSFLAHHFDTPLQQFDAAKIGMWIFLAQEVLFFSGLFVGYGVFRSWYPEAWSVGSHLLDWRMGALNTCVLLFSSFTAAQAVRYAQLGERGKVQINLLITLLCAAAFMVVKYLEYSHKFHVGFFPGKFFAPNEHGLAEIAEKASPLVSHYGTGTAPFHLRSFFGLYFVMTGLHGIHVLIGMGIIGWVMARNARGEFSKEFWTPVDLVALYWHIVDLVWIFLFPLLYLID
jgi:cytochrome c oxidase subunit 3